MNVTVRKPWGLKLQLPWQVTAAEPGLRTGRPGAERGRYRVQVAYWDHRGVRVTALGRSPLTLPYESLDQRSLAGTPELLNRVRSARLGLKVGDKVEFQWGYGETWFGGEIVEDRGYTGVDGERVWLLRMTPGAKAHEFDDTEFELAEQYIRRPRGRF